MAKKILTTLLITTLFAFVALTFTSAQTTTTATPPTTTQTTTTVTSATTTKPVVKKPVVKTNPALTCYRQKVKTLTTEMQTKKKQALTEYKNALKSATSTAAKTEANKAYSKKIKEINNWYYQQLKQAKIDCGLVKAQKATTIKPVVKKPVVKKEKKHVTSTENVATSTTSTNQ